MKNYCLVIICINKPFNCVIRLITIMIHNIRRNNSTIFNTDKLISLFDCIFDHFIWRETTFISLRQKIFSAQNFTHTVIKLSQFYKIFLFCISDNHRNLSLQLLSCMFLYYHIFKTCFAFALTNWIIGPEMITVISVHTPNFPPNKTPVTTTKISNAIRTNLICQ